MSIKILFQGDSITDASRDRADIHSLGEGYPVYTANLLKEKFGEIFEFVNQGCSGNRCEHLMFRWQTDAIDIDPDIITILIGVNDCWFFADKEAKMTNEYFEYCYRTILEQIKSETNAKILLMEPFLVDAIQDPPFDDDLAEKAAIVKRLADEYADVYVPTVDYLAEKRAELGSATLSEDGVHPSPAGAEVIAQHLAKYLSSLVETVLAEKNA